MAGGEETTNKTETRLPQERAAKTATIFFSWVQAGNKGSLPSDGRNLDRDFWNKLWDSKRTAYLTPGQVREAFCVEMVANGIDPKDPTLTKLRNFFNLTPDHPLLTKQDLENLVSGKKTLWQEKNSKATNTTGESKKGEQDSALVEKDCREFVNNAWRTFWAEKISQKILNSGPANADQLRYDVLRNGLQMIANQAIKETPFLITMPIVGESVLANMMAVPREASTLRDGYDGSAERFFKSLAAPVVGHAYYQGLFKAVFEQALRNTRQLSKEEQVKKMRGITRGMKIAFLANAGSDLRTTSKTNPDKLTALAKYINSGEKYFVDAVVKLQTT